jgi:hypothetical protein
MKHANLILAALFAFSAAAQAEVVMTDGMLVVYDPNETYVASGTLGPDTFSIGWEFSDPSHGIMIHLNAPDNLVGHLTWAISPGIDGYGATDLPPPLSAGESATVTLGHDISRLFYFSMAAFDMPVPIPFGPSVPGSGMVTASAVPEAETYALMLVGLGLVGAAVRRRNQATV